MAVVILTTGVPGCGKSYVRGVRFLVDDFLINSRGIHISNFPYNIDLIAEDVSKKINSGIGTFGFRRKKVTPDDIKNRIKIIPDDELQRWRAEKSGPWEYFKGCDLKYAHIAIDEVHNFISNNMSAEYLKKWDDFLGEVRHRGCTFEGITQDVAMVNRVLIGRAAVRYELVPAEDSRDPFFKIKMLDWYELKAGFTGSFHKTVFMYEKRKLFVSWVTNHVSRFLLIPDYFKYYNSFSASLQEKGQGATDEGRAVENEFQRRGKLSLLFWFLRRNFFTLFWRLSLAGFLFWLCFCGGLSFFITRWLDVSGAMANSNGGKIEKQVKSDSDSSSDDDFEEVKDKKTGKMVRRKKKLDAGLDVFKPAMFFEGKCWLRNGMRIEQGFEFKKREVKVLNDRKVKKVDAVERNYTLDDGFIVNMY